MLFLYNYNKIMGFPNDKKELFGKKKNNPIMTPFSSVR